MAATNENKAANSRSKAGAKKANSVMKGENTASSPPRAKTVIRLEDHVMVNVKSLVFGELIYINHKTGDTTIWSEFGDVQQISMSDLRAMKQGQAGFYSENWILPISIYSAGFDDITTEDILNDLIVSKYYKNIIDPDNFEQVCGWSTSQIESKVSLMTRSAKENLVVALNGYINNGVLDSTKKILAFEKALGCKLNNTRG